MDQQDKTQRAQPVAGMRRYGTPQLVVYGALTELTASGSGPSESAGGSGSGMTCLPANMSNPNC